MSPLCLGAMLFGSIAPDGESLAMIFRALDAGIDFIDTANVYGRGASERVVGRALRERGGRDRVVVATKVFWRTGGDDPNAGGASRHHILGECERSLRRLRTDYIDLYQLHRADPQVPIDETLRALDDLVRAGKVRYLGTSTAASWQIVASLEVSQQLGLERFACEQPPYNLLDRSIERELLPAARRFGLAVIPWSPLAGGLLSGKYARGSAPVDGRWRAGRDLAGRRLDPAAFDVIEAVSGLAQERGCTPSQLALAWCAAQPGVTSPIIGPRTLAQLEDNLGALELRLGEEDFRRLDRVAPPGGVTLPYYENARGLQPPAA